MKRLVVIAFIFLPFTLGAQDVKFHINPGFVISQIDGDSYGGYKKLGYSLGAGFRFVRSDKFEIDWSTRINQKGAREITPISLFIVRLNYLESDLVFNYVLNQKVNFGAGAYTGFIMSENAKIGYQDNGYRRLEIVPLARIGVRINEKIDINVRYSRSVYSIRKNCTGTTTPCWFNKALLFEMSYTLK